MTEQEIAVALYYDRVAHAGVYPIMIPNIKYFQWQNWESDLLYISHSGYVSEYEIKSTYSDFKADFNKIKKHQKLKGCTHNLKYFYYACPKDIIPVGDIPEYAGLLYITETYKVSIIKKAPKNKMAKVITEKEMKLLFLKGMQRYWKIQNKMNQLNLEEK